MEKGRQKLKTCLPFFTMRYNKSTPMNGQENEDKENII
jgi:hypothetical protein